MAIGLSPLLSDLLLSRLSDFLSSQVGLHFPKDRWHDLERGLTAASIESGYPEVEAYARRLLSTPLTQKQIEGLASHLTVGETYFFREKRSFEALEQQIVPELLRTRSERRLRIWSAGCCTGEEPYSIAILLDQLIPDLEKWNLTILATDINPQFLRKAAQGVYGAWSFRDMPDRLRERYFTKRQDGCFEISPRIRRMVTFSYFNLAADICPSLTNNTNAIDIIFCRNVLMYFTTAQARKVADNFHGSLVDGGWLIVSPVETSNSLFANFTAVDFPGAIFYCKLVQSRLPSVATTVASSPVSAILPESIVVDSALEQELRQDMAQPGDASSFELNAGDTPSCLARTRANEGKLAEAVEWCEKAIAADKLNPAHQYLLATIRQELGQCDEAMQSLVRAIYLDPNFVLAHFALGNLCLSQNRRREAERYFDNALALLHKYPHGETLPESEGLTAGRLVEIITSVRASLPSATVARKEKTA